MWELCGVGAVDWKFQAGRLGRVLQKLLLIYRLLVFLGYDIIPQIPICEGAAPLIM